MVYTNRDKLTVIQLSKPRETLMFTELLPVLWENLSNVIYVEVDNILYGVISIGDIDRARRKGNDYVTVNIKFTSLGPRSYMQARQIFKNKESINALPVIDANGRLLGDYTRWDDLVDFQCPVTLPENQYLDNFWKEKKRIILVKPSLPFKKKMEYIVQWEKLFEKKVESVEIINAKNLVDYYNNVDLVIFSDENEFRCISILYNLTYGGTLSWNVITTYKKLKQELTDKIIFTTARQVLNEIHKQGVRFILLSLEENENKFLSRFMEMIDNRFDRLGVKKTNVLLPQMKKEFLEEIYSEAYEKEYMPFVHNLGIKGYTYVIKDQSTPFFHAYNGERLTVNQPDEYERCIYMFGPCVIAGSLVEDKYTIASQLQDKINRAGIKCKVINQGVCGPKTISEFYKIAQTPLKTGDIVVWDSNNNISDFDLKINLTDILEKNNVPVNWVTDNPRHCNHKVSRYYAEAIFEKLLPIIQPSIKNRVIVEKDDSYIASDYINRYFAEFNPLPYEAIGSIVMNCNPFTLGHRYLIEQALNIVDFLIIFVVEENKSLFSFTERFAMVCDGVSDLDNIMVVPSGEYILSQTTFPEYFVKIADEDIVKNVENDITIFAEKIAPRLKISYRFVGEELEDIVTNEYNKAMKKILPLYGITLIEIPRLQNAGIRISATTVRKYLDEGNDEGLNLLIPESTKKLLFLENN